MSILTAREVVKEYTRGGRPFRAVDHASLEIEAGDFICVRGNPL